MALERFTGYLTTADIYPNAYKNFLKHVEKQEDGHWRWTGAVNETGYGRFGGPWHYAHRFSYLYRVGWLPLGRTFDVAHKCYQEWCVNWDCLEIETRSQNLFESKRAFAERCNGGHLWSEGAAWSQSGHRFCKLCRDEKVAKWKAKHGDRWREIQRESDRRRLQDGRKGNSMYAKGTRAACDQCGERVTYAGSGRPPKYCSNACKQKAYQARRLEKLVAERLAPPP